MAGRPGIFLLEGGEDFHALDGVDAEVGLDVHLEPSISTG
jgi:hypothetical protein